MAILNNNAIVGASGQSTGPFKIERSLRFDSVYLDRTPASTGNRRTWTWSGWIKLGTNFGTRRILFGGGAAFVAQTHPNTYIEITDDNVLGIDQVTATTGTLTIRVRTSAVLRDPSAWYHVIVAVDTTQGTDTNRVKMYINGVQQTSFSSTTYPTSNLDTGVNTTTNHKLGSYIELSAATLYFDGYMTEVNFIDGQQLAASDFGLTDSATGVWVPKKYTGTYGTNGFYLKFADNSSNTATTLGKDSSGNGNNWTPNGFSVNAGVGNDSLVDTPTPYGTDTGAGGEVRGNYCTLNPLNNPGGSTFANGNLDVTTASSTGGRVVGTVGVSSGKWYWEITPTSVAGLSLIGIAAASRVSSGGVGDFSDEYAYQNNGNKYSNSVGAAYGASYTANDVIGVALDLDAGTLVFYKNNSSQGTAYSSISGTFVPAMSDGQNANSSAFVCNFGQRPFAYTAPSGFKALCTQNLPTPTIGATSTTQAGKYFNTVLWDGTGTGTTRSISGAGFQPDFVWIKSRNQPYRNTIYDVVRGAAADKYLSSTGAVVEGDNNYAAQYGYVSAFQSDGFQVTKGTGPSDYAWVNETGGSYVSWNWRANGAGSSNTAGSISSTVSANTTAGFSIVTYTGNATAGATVGHGLGVTPSMIIVKDRVATSGAREWVVYHSSLGNTKAVFLSTTGAAYTGTNLWNNTSPTSTVFTIGNSSEGTNGSGNAMLAYCFAPIAGYSAFGSYTGNGSTDGPFIYTGFRPAFILIKASSTTSYWVIFDVARNTYNVMTSQIWPNATDAENNTYGVLDAVSNGFKLRNTTAGWNDNGVTYIYMALASNPFKYSLAR